ncbi:hypothetical protein DF186_17820, partial [Enterococcus hirae]
PETKGTKGEESCEDAKEEAGQDRREGQEQGLEGHNRHVIDPVANDTAKPGPERPRGGNGERCQRTGENRDEQDAIGPAPDAWRTDQDR